MGDEVKSEDHEFPSTHMDGDKPMETSTFVTQVDGESEGKQQRKEERNGKDSVLVPPTVTSKILRIEDECIDWVYEIDPDDFMQKPPKLPGRVDPRVVICSVADSMKFSSLNSRSAWRKQFSKQASLEFIQGTFWWIFVDKFVDSKRDGKKNHSVRYHSGSFGRLPTNALVEYGTIEQAKGVLFDSLSRSFFNLFFQMSPKTKDAFFTIYPDAVAQAVYISFSTAYPNSRAYFDITFKQDIHQRVCEWVQGVTAPKQADLSHWGGESDKRAGRGSIRKLMLMNLDNDSSNNGSGNGHAQLPALSPTSLTTGARSMKLASPSGSQSRKQMGKTRKGGDAKSYANEDTDRVNLVNVKGVTTYSTMEIAHSPLINHYLCRYVAGKPQLDQNVTAPDNNKLSFRMTQTKRVYKTIPPNYFLLEGKTRDGQDDNIAIGDDDDDDDDDDKFDNGEDGALSDEMREKLFLQKYSSETYHDVVRRTESVRQQLIHDFDKQRKQLAQELKSIQKQARKEQSELNESKRKAIKGDIHELSNYLVSMWKVEDD